MYFIMDWDNYSSIAGVIGMMNNQTIDINISTVIDRNRGYQNKYINWPNNLILRKSHLSNILVRKMEISTILM